MLVWIAAALLIYLPDKVGSQCAYPADWRTGTWADSLGRTSISFTSNQMSNYHATYRGTDVTSWTCHLQSGNLLLSRSDSLNVAGDVYYLYACMLINTESSTKYYYHLMSDQDFDISTSGFLGLRLSPTMDGSVSDICSQCAGSPGLADFIVMTNDGSSTDTSTIVSPVFASNPCDPTTTTTSTTTTTTTVATTQAPTTITTTVATTQSSMTTTEKKETQASTNEGSSSEKGPNIGAIVGGTIAGVIVVTVGVVIGVTKYKKMW